MVQALASGKPAVGFELDGTPEVILDGKTGFIAKPGDVKTVADKLIYLIGNPDIAREMGAEGRNMVSEKFDWRKMADILEVEYITGLHLEGRKREHETDN